jgi:hypothetical protein
LRKPERRSARWIEGQSGPKFAFRVKIGSVTRKWTRLKDIYKKVDPWSRLMCRQQLACKILQDPKFGFLAFEGKAAGVAENWSYIGA